MITQYCHRFIGVLSVLTVITAGCEFSGLRHLEGPCRLEISFDQHWLFQPLPYGTDDSPLGFEKPTLDDSGWRRLHLPHDWAIEGGFDMTLPTHTGKLPYSGIGWYRKHFTVPSSDRGKRLFIDFDGAMSQAKVWLNGQLVGQRPYGYSSFRVELTDAINVGTDNVLAVRLNNPPESSRWYPGGGIYRHTRLIKTNPVHIAHWGTSIVTSELRAKNATITLHAEVHNQSDKTNMVSVDHEIIPADHPEKILAKTSPSSLSICPGHTEDFTCTVTLDDPKPWSIETPTIYILRTTVKQNGRVVDLYQTPFGIRTLEFDAKRGFLLNGKKVYLKGVCLHHDLGPLGTAVHPRGIERQLELLKEMGCNSIRTSHNPPAPELPELCDRMGFVVIDEAFDCWQACKTKNDYGRHFNDWHETDIASLVRRDRNHPCVIAWSSGNEIHEQGGTNDGHALSQMLTDLYHRLDPTRPVTAGCNWPSAATNGFADTLDLYGFNYKPHLYAEFARNRPDQPFYSSESSSCVSSRGEYFFPVSDDKSQGFFNYQVSSYDLYAPRWAMAPDWEFKGQDENPTCLGEYVWTGFDYLGEPTPYNNDASIAVNFHTDAEKQAFEKQLQQMDGKSPSRSSYFGIMDLCGFKKDRFYLYQARWRPTLPMAHILPHWNWPERAGQVTPVHVYTSGDEAELFLNGRSLGRKKMPPLAYRLRWDEVVYEPGTLKVIAYKDGKPWAEDIMRTTGPAAALNMQADRNRIAADGRDLSYITVTVTDKEGLPVPRSHPHITFSIEGPGEIAATGNGNATDHTSFLSKERDAYNGLCLVIIRSLAGKTGTIRLRAASEGLADTEVTIVSR